MVLDRRFWLWGIALVALALGVALALSFLRGTPHSTGSTDQVVLQEAMQVQLTRSAPGADQALLQEAVEVQVTRRTPEPAPPPSGGEQSTIRDSVELILRDAWGRLKKVGP